MTKKDISIEEIRKEKPLNELVNFSILNIDKPTEWTSFDVVNKIRSLFRDFKITKCGHFGTLDPNVTGVLPICLGDACKIQELFMHHQKIYLGKMKIHKPIKKEKLAEEMKKFLGKINQLPPRISRVKRVLRQREIMKFNLLNFNEKKLEAEFLAEVEAGTYIRKLIDDLGKNIQGAHMTELRRLKAGLFSSEDNSFITLERVEKVLEDYKKDNSKENEEKLRDILIPAEIILELIDPVEVKPEFLSKLKHGSPLFDEMLVNEKEARKIINKKIPFGVICDNQLVEIAKFSDKFEQKSILAKPESVLIK